MQQFSLQPVKAERTTISFLLTQYNNSSHLVRIAQRASEGNKTDWAVGTETSCQHKTVGVSLKRWFKSCNRKHMHHNLFCYLLVR